MGWYRDQGVEMSRFRDQGAEMGRFRDQGVEMGRFRDREWRWVGLGIRGGDGLV